MSHRSSPLLAVLLACEAAGCGLLADLGAPPEVAGIDGGPDSSSAVLLDASSLLGPTSDALLDSNAPPETSVPDGAAPEEGGPDTGAAPPSPLPPDAHCNLAAPFGAPIVVSEIDALAENSFDARLSVDELTVYWASDALDPGNTLNLRISTATRAHYTDPFGSPQEVAGIDLDGNDECAPSITQDGLSLYLNVLNGGVYSIRECTRATPFLPFGAPVEVANVNAPSGSANPTIVPDGTALYFFTEPNGTPEIVASRNVNEVFQAPVLATALDTGEANGLAVSADQLTIAFASWRNDPNGVNQDIWMSHRKSTAVDWDPPTEVAEVNSPSTDDATWISEDGCRLYLQSNRSGTFQIYLATRPD